MPAPDGQEYYSGLRGKIGHEICGAIRESGLVAEGDTGVVLISGGADSVALLRGLTGILGPESLVALHVNYGLREAAGADEDLVREICAELGVELVVHQAGKPAGNVQAWARAMRLEEAERLRADRMMDWIAVGHNRSDQAETMLYRLAVSPGVRSLLAMPPRSGRVIRPLLGLDGKQIRFLLGQVSSYTRDSSNEDPGFARNRVRHRILPEMRGLNSKADLNLVRTRAELEEDEEAFAALVMAALPESPWQPEEGIGGEILEHKPAAVRRRILRWLAERILDRPVAVTRELTEEVLRLLGEPEGGALDLGGGDQFVIRRGRVEVVSGGGSGGGDIPGAVAVPLESGSVWFGEWEIRVGRTDEPAARSGFGNPWNAFLDDQALLEWLIESSPGPDDLLLTLRSWRAGDRIEPLGMSGSKKLQDVFTDALVPAPRRRTWPVLAVGETVIWVPGLVRSKHLLIGGPEKPVLRLQATPPFPI